jgi:cobalt-zinc-cadmium efflux system protein
MQEHEHHHGLPHSDGSVDFGKAFALGVTLNVAIVAVQAVFGFLGNSVALLADAGHNLSDVLSLLAAWGATWLAKHPPTQRFSYGLKGSSIIAALFNAVFLLIVMGALSWEALRRLFSPEPVAGQTMMIVAAIAMVLNGVTAWMFMHGRHDLNIRGAFLHMAADAAVSAGVIVAGLIILLTDWLWVDPLVSLIVNAVIVWGTSGLLTESVAMTLNATPSEIDAHDVCAFLQSQPGVQNVHDLHIWPMSTTETALTAHLVMPAGHPGDVYLLGLGTKLKSRFGIGHPTFQIESEGAQCPLAPEHVV